MQFEKAKARAHIFEGYHIAIDNIDRIVEIMKTSKSIPEAKECGIEAENLVEAFEAATPPGSIYESVYDRTSKKDIVLNVPIDLRRHYNVEAFSNFFIS